VTIDATKTSPEKLAEMNDALITDNNYLRGRIIELETKLLDLQSSSPNPRLCQMAPPLADLISSEKANRTTEEGCPSGGQTKCSHQVCNT